MKVRFQADADLNLIIVLALVRREPSIDFQTAVGSRLAGLSDLEVLAVAAKEKRVLVTHDHKTMPNNFSEFVSSRFCPGLIIVPQRLPPADAVNELLLIWHATDAEEWTNRVCYLPL